MFDELCKSIPAFEGRSQKLALVTPDTAPVELLKKHPWLQTERLVVKPDQLFSKRGKHGLICMDVDWPTAWAWIAERMNKQITVGKVTGNLTHFLIEPFWPHAEMEEFILAIRPEQEEDILYFSLHGGIYVEENWDKVFQTQVPVLTCIDEITLNLPELGAWREAVIAFIKTLYQFYTEAGFHYLEINPCTFSGDSVVPLDLVVKMDDTAAFECKKIWGILNVDGCLGASFVDLFNTCDCFTKEEADQIIELGCLNALFAVGRSIGLIGHILDQQRLKQPLYRVPYDAIAYMTGC